MITSLNHSKPSMAPNYPPRDVQTLYPGPALLSFLNFISLFIFIHHLLQPSCTSNIPFPQDAPLLRSTVVNSPSWLPFPP